MDTTFCLFTLSCMYLYNHLWWPIHIFAPSFLTNPIFTPLLLFISFSEVFGFLFYFVVSRFSAFPFPLRSRPSFLGLDFVSPSDKLSVDFSKMLQATWGTTLIGSNMAVSRGRQWQHTAGDTTFTISKDENKVVCFFILYLFVLDLSFPVNLLNRFSPNSHFLINHDS